MFNSNIAQSIEEELFIILKINEILCHEKYVRLSMRLKRDKKISFQVIKELYMRRLMGWYEQSLTKVSVYSISLFKLLMSLCSELERIDTRYWWSNKKEGGGLL